MYMGLILIAIAFGALLLIVVLAITARSDDPVAARVQELGAGQARPAASGRPSAVTAVVLPSVPTQAQVDAARRARSGNQKPSFRDRLVQAGLYRAYSPATFAILRIFLAVVPLGIGLMAGVLGLTPLWLALVGGGCLSAFGTIAPSFWLDFQKAERQSKIRRSLPDALDVIVVCMEGGLSLTGAFARVAQELATAHPLLAMELRIVQREVQMGRTTGEALRYFAKRFDLEELRSLAAVISQAERFGTSVVKALSVYAETMRLRRHQRAEELAHQASIKMIFPTLFCIFPAIFIVILGPAAVRIYEAFVVNGGPG
jgi:tight adherence protein C